MNTREEVLKIIRDHDLSNQIIDRLVGIEGCGRKYREQTVKESKFINKVERTIIEWRNEMFAKRRKLLHYTPYGHLYNNML